MHVGLQKLSCRNTFQDVAQSGSASGLGPEGQEFKSLHPDLFVRTVARHQACIGSSKNAEVIELVVKT